MWTAPPAAAVNTQSLSPKVHGAEPEIGPTRGGMTVTILGEGFAYGAMVSFGGVDSPSVTMTADGNLDAILPAVSTPGPVSVTVTHPDGRTHSLPAGFTYEVWDFELNELVLGSSANDNVLKGMSVVTDDAMNLAYVTGIMTDVVGVVDLATRALLRTYALSNTTQSTKKLAFDDLSRQLWCVSNKTDCTLWLTDPDSGTVLGERDISSEIGSSGGSYPIQSVVVDPLRQRFYALSNNFAGSRVLVYDSTLTLIDQILDGITVWTLRWDESNDALLALTAPKLSSGVLPQMHRLPAGDESSMTSVTLTLPAGAILNPSLFTHNAIGDLFLASGKFVWKASGVTGNPIWVNSLANTATAIELSGTELGVLHKYGNPGSADIYVSRLSTLGAATGTSLGYGSARFEASRMDATPSAGGFIVGNGGDASLSHFPKGFVNAEHFKVGSAAEDVLLTPDGERMLVLNRLGGSQLIECDLTSGLGRVVNSCDWPVRMMMRPADNELFVLSHFESKLVVHDLTTLVIKSEIPLGLPPCYTDTIMAMAGDDQGELFAALVAEQGKLVVVDGNTQTILATINMTTPALGVGPGRMNGAVDNGDPANRRLFVYLADDETLYRYEEMTSPPFQLTGTIKVVLSSGVKNSYGFRTVYYSDGMGKIFVGNVQIDPDTLMLEGFAADAHRFVGERATTLYAQHKSSFGTSQLEQVYIIDGPTLATIGMETIGLTAGMDVKVHFDTGRGRMAFSMPIASEVHVTKFK